MPLPINDITNPEVIKFLIENYEKTARLRMRWNQTHEARLKLAATIQRTEKGYQVADVLKTTMANGMAATTRENVNAVRNRRLKPIRDAIFVPGVKNLRKSHPISKIGLGDTKEDPRLCRPDEDLTFDPVMRPIDPKHKDIIYEGLPFYGRNVYLKTRMRYSPENKYYFKESVGWDYGWRLRDSYFGKQKAAFGRVSRLTHDRSISGPQPDPDYYKSPDRTGVSKCEA